MASSRERFSFLHGGNEAFVAQLYQRFLEDPNKVDPSWREFFGKLGDDERAILGELTGASWSPRETRVIGGNGAAAEKEPPVPKKPNGEAATGEEIRAATQDSIRALMLIRSYRVRGHLYADLDPLGLATRDYHPELEYQTYGFTDEDLDRQIFISGYLGLETATLREIVDVCKATYADKIGVEFMHIQEPDQKSWIQERIEAIHNRTDFTKRGRKAILERLTAAEVFEKYLDKKFTGTKRFGLDGGESAIPALEQIMKRGGQMGLKEIAIGMPHRGRLNVLASMMGKPYRAIFAEFLGISPNPEGIEASGDVKYHLGASSDREFDGNWIHLSLTANPSHLEAVNPVVCGKVRAKQYQYGPGGDDTVMGLLLHGDAAFSGQGLVPETLDLSELSGYRTGGTIHFVVNNQIGFTTNPVQARSGPYCTEVAKIIQAPIFHVNGDDPEAVVHVSRIAMEFRQRFKKDVVIDMFCYRRHGHNEGDEPSFTQPLMYKKIATHPTTRAIYAERLVDDGLLTDEEAEKMVEDFETLLDEEFDAAQSYKPNKADWLEGVWRGVKPAGNDYLRGETAVEEKTLKAIGEKLTSVPDGFNLNRKIERQFKKKREILESGKGFDWALGEALAYGSLVAEGTPVRLSGQDSGRGTFSHRHAVLYDQETEEKYLPLLNVAPNQARFEVIDSPLAEASVLGFEYGYSMAEPNALILWEAQFGDFANGAQIIIDQFISSGESKWLRMSGLTLLLPHGYEGQGPEHSSARIERFLQLSAEHNMQIVNCTTPAQFFHVLRRQVRRDIRKPLIVFTPKSLLRHKLCVSDIEEFGPGSSFHRVLLDGGANLAGDDKIKRVVMCSGKVYYDLFEAREEREIDDVYLLRMEQLYPWPIKSVTEELKRFKNAEIVWCQEEPKNMGAWSFVNSMIEETLEPLDVTAWRARYVGRAPAASPATGDAKRHKEEQERLVDEALTVD